MKELFISIILLFICSEQIFSQSQSDWVFDDSVLPEIRITIDPDSLHEILRDGNEQSDHEFPATLNIIKNGVKETIDSVGFRLRGNTSRDSQKKSYKISFNTFIKGREYRGLDKMNINGEHNDPSIIRSKISWDIFEKMEVKAPRSNHVAFYINDELYGLYINVEHIDNEFLTKYFENDNGNLYKCLFPADLSYRGPNAGDYNDYKEFGRKVYDLKTNELENNYSDLAALITFLEDASDQQFEEEIHDYLNVDATLKWMVIDVLTGNWDNYRYNKNNFYLYNDQSDNRFTVIPYDYDNTLGIDFIQRDWATRNLYTWDRRGGGESRPLTKRLLEIQKFKDWYSYYINKTIEKVFNEDSLFPEIDRLKTLIQSTAEADTFRTKDYGYDIDDFNNSYDQALGDHVDYGLKPFITTRKNAAIDQLQSNNIYPIIHDSESKLLNNNGNKTIVVRVGVEDQDLKTVKVDLDIPEENNDFDLKDNGEGFDHVAGDGIYSGAKDLGIYSEDINFFVLAEDNEGQTSRFPYNPAKKITLRNNSTASGLMINELMASNSSTIQDESGSYPDWVEIFNTSENEISLKGYFLTDDLANPDKWAFPDTTITSEGFLLVWVDDDEKEGPLHASFNLNKNGEDLGLYKQDGDAFTAINTLTFGAQTTDVSYARDGDGAQSFVFRNEPTPGTTNGIILNSEDYTEIPGNVELHQNYPNPFNPSTTISFSLINQEKVSLEVFTITGQLVEIITNRIYNAGNHSVKYNGENLASGVYFYRLKTSGSTEIKRFTLIK